MQEHMTGTRLPVYGPRVHRERRTLAPAPASRPDFDPRKGRCHGLPARVADRWFGGATGTFEAHTARTMCGRCPVQTECLAAEVAVPRRHYRGMIRGGAYPWEITAMRWAHARERTSPMRLAQAFVARFSLPLVGEYGLRDKRDGYFVSPTPFEEV